MAVVAYKCPDIEVVVVDINDARIKAWNSDDLPIYEPGLDEVVKSCRGRNLFFSTDTHKHVSEADIVFVRYQKPDRHGLKPHYVNTCRCCATAILRVATVCLSIESAKMSAGRRFMSVPQPKKISLLFWIPV